MISWSSLSVLFIFFEWVIRLLMLPVVTSRSKPTPAMAWLLIIFFEPFFGMFIYLLLAEGRLPRKRIQLHKQIKQKKAIDSLGLQYAKLIQPIDPKSLDQPGQTLATCLSSIPVLGGNDVQLLSKTNDVIEELIAEIDSAKHTVHLLYYIFLADTTGEKVLESLCHAAKRGVKCRILADAVGSSPFFRSHASKLKQKNIDVCPALPVNLFRRKLARIDLRNHRKLAIIDGQTAFAGSQNVVNANYGHKNLIWHDLTLKITGPAVLELQSVFIADWHFETGETLEGDGIFCEPKVEGNTLVQTLPSGPTDEVERYRHVVVAAIHAAQKEIVITTPYFVPDDSLLDALKVAVLRQVSVKLVLPKKVDQLLVGAASRAYYDDLLKAGVTLYHFIPGLIHAKSLTIDNKVAFVGSANFDIRSFHLNFELNLILYGDEITTRVRQKQQEYIDNSESVLLEDWLNRSSSARFVQNLARLMSPLL